MYTGITQAVGEVSAVDFQDKLLHYAVTCPQEHLQGLLPGASVSIEGVCQTVVAVEGTTLRMDAIEETLRKTTLKYLKKGSPVNFERSAKFGDEIGGHVLAGHVFGTARIVQIEENRYLFSYPNLKYVFEKGFIAIDGMSLTVVSCDRAQGTFSVHLIPETLKRTTIGKKKVGDEVNLEFDALTQAAVETVENILKFR